MPRILIQMGLHQAILPPDGFISICILFFISVQEHVRQRMDGPDPSPSEVSTPSSLTVAMASLEPVLSRAYEQQR